MHYEGISQTSLPSAPSSWKLFVIKGGGTQIADFFGLGGGTGLIFGLGKVLGGIFFEGVSFPLKDVKETSTL